MSAMNDAIDGETLEHLRVAKDYKLGSYRNIQLAAIIRFEAPESPNPNEPRHWWLQELASRSCQRLRKKGLINYDRKRGWLYRSEKENAKV